MECMDKKKQKYIPSEVRLANSRGLVSDSHAIPKKADGIHLAQVMGGV